MDAAAGPPVVDAPYIRHWIHYRYQACGFQRYLSDSDMKVRYSPFDHGWCETWALVMACMHPQALLIRCPERERERERGSVVSMIAAER